MEVFPASNGAKVTRGGMRGSVLSRGGIKMFRWKQYFVVEFLIATAMHIYSPMSRSLGMKLFSSSKYLVSALSLRDEFPCRSYVGINHVTLPT